MADRKQDLLDLKDPNYSSAEYAAVECLGKTFSNDKERREYFTAILAEKLNDPEFRRTDGFPIGDDENILELSNPPFYTACPNPFVEDFIRHYGRTYNPEREYKRDPYATDVSEGKTTPIYNAHSYHTKVPHKAIMRYILHYTNPGDLIMDSFCGTGMAGVAAELCGDYDEVESLGYKVEKSTGEVFSKDDDGKWVPFSKLGERKVILNDLGSAATFMAGVYNSSFNCEFFSEQAEDLLKNAESQLGWMYETKHKDGVVGKINFTIWSDVFVCSECAEDIIFWDAAIDLELAKVRDNFPCPSCNVLASKKNLPRKWISSYNPKSDCTTKVTAQVPVLINYSIEGAAKRFEKRPDDDDLALIKKVESMDIEEWFPMDMLPAGDKTSEPISNGIVSVDLFYTKRNLLALSKIYSLIEYAPLRFLFTAALGGLSKLNQFHLKNYIFGGGGVNPGPRKGVIYTPSISLENPPLKVLRDRLRTQVRAFRSKDNCSGKSSIVSMGSATRLPISSEFDNSLDYVFIDPPFGSNLMYSELSFMWESWLKIFTENSFEAIENKTQKKTVDIYRSLMTQSFKEAYRLLKPGRWITIEFSNTKSHVWNNIQTAISDSGFIVGNVSALDKKQGGINSIVGSTAVKQDLVISAYKPDDGFENRFSRESNDEGVWDFTRTHLSYLPVVKRQANEVMRIPERDPRILFDQVVSFFVRNMRDVPISSKEFQQGLVERYSKRDGMIFLPEQVVVYDRARASVKGLRQLVIFVDDEASAIEWLRQHLTDKPQSYQEIHPKFISELSGWKKAEVLLELAKILEQNFIRYDGNGPVPTQINSYLTKNWHEVRDLGRDSPALKKKAKDRWYVPNPDREEDLQKLRERDLLKQFEEYKSHSGRQLKTVRMEAVRCGFKKAWQDKDYTTIIQVAEKIPESLLQEDPKLLMWYDTAMTRESDSSLF
ncbi:DNA methyltransferase [Marinobacter sp. S6332]|uniref:DNA methyltransferase n=1 Tax=Marinobacter sp. S6332 TaxID=2926403 RepID=UPI001FF4C3DF|nr:DNA methyltransferase [Marinobacter sp. S6332]MCK0165796.1 site-specific DNA-methyltransferase [Marinobacter sp. S6332]